MTLRWEPPPEDDGHSGVFPIFYNRYLGIMIGVKQLNNPGRV